MEGRGGMGTIFKSILDFGALHDMTCSLPGSSSKSLLLHRVSKLPMVLGRRANGYFSSSLYHFHANAKLQ